MYNQNIFTDVNKYVSDGKGNVTYTGILIASKLNQKNGQDYPLLDAIDIDWNGSWIESMSTYLYTTEDLIAVLDHLSRSNESSKLWDEINKIWNQINEITASYVTYSYLEDHLSTYWQRKLLSGDFIQIDEETNTIHAYGLPTYEYLESTYTNNHDFRALIEHLHNDYYDKPQTEQVAYQAAYNAIQLVIDGADNAFDTLKEVADWILEQNLWVKVPLTEIKEVKASENWPENYYYTFDEETGEYTPVNNILDVDDVTQDNAGYSIYWKKENYLIELKRLITRVNSLDDRVGFEFYDEETYTYTYTGLFWDIEDLRQTDKSIINELNRLDKEVEKANKLSSTAYTMGYTAYNTAYIAYGIAYEALEQSFESIGKASLAYEMAYTAIVKVGDEHIDAGWVNVDIAYISAYTTLGYEFYYFDEEGNRYDATEPYDPEKEYFYYREYVPGTGLTGRVEVVEEKADKALTTANVALVSSYESLYHLSVNNSNSTYVNLGLHPEDFNGSRDRVLTITTQEASMDRHSGEITSQGLVNISTALDIYAYMSSWMYLYVDHDVEFPEPTKEPTVDPGDLDEE